MSDDQQARVRAMAESSYEDYDDDDYDEDGDEFDCYTCKDDGGVPVCAGCGMAAPTAAERAAMFRHDRDRAVRSADKAVDDFNLTQHHGNRPLFERRQTERELLANRDGLIAALPEDERSVYPRRGPVLSDPSRVLGQAREDMVEFRGMQHGMERTARALAKAGLERRLRDAEESPAAPFPPSPAPPRWTAAYDDDDEEADDE